MKLLNSPPGASQEEIDFLADAAENNITAATLVSAVSVKQRVC